MSSSDMQPSSASPSVHVHQDAEVVQVITIQDGATVRDIVGRQNVYQYTPPRPADSATLDAAQALLTSMPTSDAEPPPAIAPLPYGSHIKGFRPNSLFVGRQAELRGLARALAKQPGGQSIVISTGIGGVGKTQLAIEFAHRYGQYFAGGVFWVTMEQAENIPTEVAACGAGGLVDWRPDYVDLKLAEQLPLVLAAWQSPLPRLLIFDNCEDEALLAQWRPPTGGCRVLVTSRRTTWDPTLGATAFPLDVLPREASVVLLRKFRPTLSAKDTDAIAAELGDLPLARHVAGSFLGAYRKMTTAAFLTDLRSPQLLSHPALQGRGSSLRPTGRELHVAKVFALSYDRLDARDVTDALAIALLARAARFAPGVPILRDILTATVSPEADDAALLIEDALRRLVDLGLIEELLLEDEDAGDLQENTAPSPTDEVEVDETVATVRLHRLLSAFAWQVSDDTTAQPAAEDMLIRVTNQLDASTFLAAAELVLPHLRHVTDAALPHADRRAAGLCNNMGWYLQGMANYPAAQPYYERALAIREQVLGATHPDTAGSLNNLGTLFDSMGELAGARPYYERALAIREQVLGATHPDTASSLNNLGDLLQAQGELAQARPYYERALAICEQVLGATHPDTARSLNNLGDLLKAMGELAGARPYYERALEIYEQVLGPSHPDTANSLGNLGVLHAYAGRFSEALPLVERALSIREHILGAEHPATLATSQTLTNIRAAMDAA
jgi:tetratricopeptide (TPR) repeat protein